MRDLADGGHTEAQLQLGLMLTFGHGLEADPEEGRFWLRQAALQGVSAAQLNLGTIYARGIGTRVDLVQAWAWLTLAGDLDDKALGARDSIAGQLTVNQRRRAESMAGGLRQRMAPR